MVKTRDAYSGILVRSGFVFIKKALIRIPIKFFMTKFIIFQIFILWLLAWRKRTYNGQCCQLGSGFSNSDSLDPDPVNSQRVGPVFGQSLSGFSAMLCLSTNRDRYRLNEWPRVTPLPNHHNAYFTVTRLMKEEYTYNSTEPKLFLSVCFYFQSRSNEVYLTPKLGLC